MFVTPPYTPIGGFVDMTPTTPGTLGSRLRAPWLNYLSGQFKNALDAVGGGYYQLVGDDIRISSDIRQLKINAPNPAFPIELLGHVKIGLTDDTNYSVGQGSFDFAVPTTFSEPVTFTSDGDITLESGCTLTGELGSAIVMDAGSTTTINGSATLAGTNTLSGATTASNTVALNGAVTVDAVTTFTTNGAITANAVATFTKGVTVTQSTTNTTAITATGNGTAAAAAFVGGTTGAGITMRSGTAPTDTAPTCAAQSNGYIQLTGADPTGATDPGSNNALHGCVIPKASATIDTSYAFLERYNVASITNVTGDIWALTFVRPMANDDYGVKIFVHGAPGYSGAHNGTKTTTGFEFVIFKTNTLALGFGVGATEAYIEVTGRQ